LGPCRNLAGRDAYAYACKLTYARGEGVHFSDVQLTKKIQDKDGVCA
jgi:hypothetical protein